MLSFFFFVEGNFEFKLHFIQFMVLLHTTFKRFQWRRLKVITSCDTKLNSLHWEWQCHRKKTQGKKNAICLSSKVLVDLFVVISHWWWFSVEIKMEKIHFMLKRGIQSFRFNMKWRKGNVSLHIYFVCKIL